MPTHIRRFLIRFAIFAVVDIIFVLCLISGFRLWYVQRAASNAAKYAEAGQHEKALHALRLAHQWAPAYPDFSNTVAELYESAAIQTGSPDDTPAPEARSFTADIPAVEKALIPSDLLASFIYRRMEARRKAKEEEQAEAELRASQEEKAGRPSVAVHGTTASSDSRPPRPSYDPKAMWGAVKVANAPLYDETGTKIREIPAGSLVNVKETRRTKTGSILVCSVKSREGQFENVILKQNDVSLNIGYPMSSVPKEELQLTSRKGEILAAIQTRRDELMEAASKRNPYHSEYLEVLKAYKAIGDKSKNIKAEYEKATGSDRIELANQLRTLKNEQFVLMPKYKEIKQKKQQWDRQNGSSATDTNNDPQIRQLRKELEAVETKIRIG
jgi:hypothetical protein